MYGMKMSGLNEDVLREVMRIYDRTVGGRAIELCSSVSGAVDYIKETLSRTNAADLRYGSKLGESGHSDHYEYNAKLVVWYERTIWQGNRREDMVIRFSFDPNLFQGEEAKRLEKEFENTVDRFLLEKDMAIGLNTQ